MKKSAQPSSTQAFTEILDIRENIVLQKNDAACIIIRVTSVNFALLSGQEQDSKVFAYAALLNSLSFPIQILIRSKPVRIAPYIDSLTAVMQQSTNERLKSYVEKYKDFVNTLAQTTTVLDKQFYIIIPYSTLEGGAIALVAKKSTNSLDNLFQLAQAALQTKAESLLPQIHRLSLQATILEKNELTKLFYDIYNQGELLATTGTDIQNPIVKGRA